MVCESDSALIASNMENGSVSFPIIKAFESCFSVEFSDTDIMNADMKNRYIEVNEVRYDFPEELFPIPSLTMLY